MQRPTTIDPTAIFDDLASRFLQTDFSALPLGTPEAVTVGLHTILVNRDPIRPDANWCVTTLRDGRIIGATLTNHDDLTMKLESIFAAIREPAIYEATEAAVFSGFICLE